MALANGQGAWQALKTHFEHPDMIKLTFHQCEADLCSMYMTVKSSIMINSYCNQFTKLWSKLCHTYHKLNPMHRTPYNDAQLLDIFKGRILDHSYDNIKCDCQCHK